MKQSEQYSHNSNARSRCWTPILTGVVLFAATASPAVAASISIPNGSFESQVAPPTYPYVTTFIDSWQKAPQPAWFDSNAYGFTWDQTAGLFQNTPVGAANHIDNMDGNQGLYFLAFPQVGLFQDYNTTDWNHTTPTHAFNATYQVGMSYTLTLGVIGGGGGMPEGTGMELGLYYLDGANNRVMLGVTPIVYTAANFPTTTHFIDYNVAIPFVQAGDAWAGRYIGIELMSTSGTGAGYWDMDNVRLTEVPEPGALALVALGLGGRVWRRRRVGERG